MANTKFTGIPDVDVPYLTEEILIKIIDECKSIKNYSKLISTLNEVYSNIRSLSRSYKKTGNTLNATHMYTGLDYSSMKRAYTLLFQLPDVIFVSAIANAVVTLARNLQKELHNRDANLYSDDELVHVFLVVLEIQTLGSADFLQSGFSELCRASKWITVDVQVKLAQAWSAQGASSISTILENLHNLITHSIVQPKTQLFLQDDHTVSAASNIMKILFYANILTGTLEPPGFNQKLPDDELAVQLGINTLDCRKPLIAFSEFYNEVLSDYVHIVTEFCNYRNDIHMFSFMRYPFMLTPATKTFILFCDNRTRMYSEKRRVVHNIAEDNYLDSYHVLYLPVRREHIIEDVTVNLEMAMLTNPHDLKKKLVVEFEGEQAVDYGGVSKELFQLVIKEFMKRDYGMFILQNDSQTMWFNTTNPLDERKFTLTGIVLGLAAHNSVILSINFPRVLYKKLKGRAGTFEDLAEWNPTLYNSLKQLLEYTEDDIEDVFMQTFRVSYQNTFGTLLHYDLMKNGDQTFVSQKNKHEFVKLYADFLLNKSVEKQFQAFYKGFHMVVDESLFDLLFRPEEVELVICGSKNFDFNELANNVEYDQSYTESTPIITYFWSVLSEFTSEQQRQFLQFTTGSDRVPIRGLSMLNLRIIRNGPDTDRLPTSFTCYNILLLPEYSSKEKLRNRLLTAMKYSIGFGLS